MSYGTIYGSSASASSLFYGLRQTQIVLTTFTLTYSLQIIEEEWWTLSGTYPFGPSHCLILTKYWVNWFCRLV